MSPTKSDPSAWRLRREELARGEEAARLRETLSYVRGLAALTGGPGPRDERVATLRSRGLDYERVCAKVAEEGALSKLVLFFEAHAENADVCADACTALRNITGGMVGLARLAVKAGCVKPLLAALTAHARVEAVCAPACGTLQNLALPELELGRFLIQTGGVPALVAAAAAHPAARKVALAALERLGYDERGNRRR